MASAVSGFGGLAGERQPQGTRRIHVALNPFLYATKHSFDGVYLLNPRSKSADSAGCVIVMSIIQIEH